VKDTIIMFSKFNPYTGARLMAVFQQVNNLKPEWKTIVTEHLKTIKKECEDEPTLYGLASSYLR